MSDSSVNSAATAAAEPARRLVKYRLVGRVQGVGLRQFLRNAADDAGVSGWARNEPDGSVTALLCGEAAVLEALLPLLRRGSPAAEVVTVTELMTEAEDEPQTPFAAI